MLRKLGLLTVVAVVAFALVPGAYAGVIPVYALDGSQPGIGHDPDKPAPLVTAEGFYASGSSNGGSGGDYNSVRFSPAAIGMAGLTLGQITDIAYDAKTVVAGLKDWRAKVYTVDQNGAAAGWYGVRLEAETTSSGTTFMTHDPGWDRITSGTGGGDYYANSDGTLPANFSTLLGASGSQQVAFFDIIAGANSGGHDYNTFLNNITIAATGFQTATLQAAVTPTPVAASAGVMLMGMIATKRRRSC